MLPSLSMYSKLLNINLKLPPELGELAKRLNDGLDTAIMAAWWDGCRTGVIAASLVILLLFAIFKRN